MGDEFLGLVQQKQNPEDYILWNDVSTSRDYMSIFGSLIAALLSDLHEQFDLENALITKDDVMLCFKTFLPAGAWYSGYNYHHRFKRLGVYIGLEKYGFRIIAHIFYSSNKEDKLGYRCCLLSTDRSVTYVIHEETGKAIEWRKEAIYFVNDIASFAKKIKKPITDMASKIEKGIVIYQEFPSSNDDIDNIHMDFHDLW